MSDFRFQARIDALSDEAWRCSGALLHPFSHITADVYTRRCLSDHLFLNPRFLLRPEK